MRLGGHDLDLGPYTGGPLRRAEIVQAAPMSALRAGVWAAAHCAPALSGVIERVGRTGSYDPVLCGEAIAALLLEQGASLADLHALAAEGLRRLAPQPATQPAPAQAPSRASDPADPYPGLKLWGKTYPEWGRTTPPSRAPIEQMTWADCGRATKEGRIVEVVAQLNADGVPAVWEG